MRTIPLDLAEALAGAELTFEQLGDQLGVTRQAVGHWVNGNARPGGPTRRLLAQVFRVELAVVDSWFEQRATA